MSNIWTGSTGFSGADGRSWCTSPASDKNWSNNTHVLTGAEDITINDTADTIDLHLTEYQGTIYPSLNILSEFKGKLGSSNTSVHCNAEFTTVDCPDATYIKLSGVSARTGQHETAGILDDEGIPADTHFLINQAPNALPPEGAKASLIVSKWPAPMLDGSSYTGSTLEIHSGKVQFGGDVSYYDDVGGLALASVTMYGGELFIETQDYFIDEINLLGPATIHINSMESGDLSTNVNGRTQFNINHQDAKVFFDVSGNDSDYKFTIQQGTVVLTGSTVNITEVILGSGGILDLSGCTAVNITNIERYPGSGLISNLISDSITESGVHYLL